LVGTALTDHGKTQELCRAFRPNRNIEVASYLEVCGSDRKINQADSFCSPFSRVLPNKFATVGWHAFRHKYRSWLDETGAPMKVQQELMRHGSIQTTMNVYGQAMTSSKRQANSKVVEMVLKPVPASA
jgi:integrase